MKIPIQPKPPKQQDRTGFSFYMDPGKAEAFRAKLEKAGVNASEAFRILADKVISGEIEFTPTKEQKK